MNYLLYIGIIFLNYLVGSIPTGYIIIKMSTGKDIRTIQSGRTGGTNAMRAGGFWAGFSTAILDITKGAVTVWIANALMPGNTWLQVFSPVAAIIGHNYSIFLARKNEGGKLALGGGAGGAVCLGGSIGLWGPSGAIIFFLAAFIFYFIGYASVTTMSVAGLSILIFAYRAVLFNSPWVYVLYGVLAELLLLYSLRPNLKALREGTERLHGFRLRKKKLAEES